MLKTGQTEKKKIDILSLILSVIAVLTITAVGTFLLKMQNVDRSVIMQPENDVTFDQPQPEAAQSAVPQVININTATKEELMLLSGIGADKAEKIIEYREKEPFKKPKDITKVKGIGEKTYEALADKICVE
ncbi:helix-hairpin-helix domain-containing protein [Congzhengia sp.]|uniref:ComEA family DNA-binding protein n=1 Tax=Congzhengia sp. TaxID=2944168 RepID=UPI00307887BE